MISVNEVSKNFVSPNGETLQVLKRISFSVKAGQSLAIQGPSGSGKSTLLALLAGLESPTTGDVVVDGESLLNKTESSLSSLRATKFGFVFQSFHLLQNFSAYQNVKIAAEIAGMKDAATLATAALQRVGLADRVHHHPNQLSGGECQRVAIARAIVTNPKIILADEPTGSLDHGNAERIFDLLLRLCRENDSSLILVTHDASLATTLDVSIRLERGEIV